MTDNRQSLSDLASLTANAPAAAAAPAADAPIAPVQPAAPLRAQEIDSLGRAYATGRRKDAVARVWVKPGPARSRSMAAIRKSTSLARPCVW